MAKAGANPFQRAFVAVSFAMQRTEEKRYGSRWHNGDMLGIAPSPCNPQRLSKPHTSATPVNA
jgi:hypothetical protein